ncbi:hypothetical protein HPB48_021379 [Haemaphysalis longicornis]|uniref:SHSP domain-containing protein n=1 Tax=Haemaphysalis longicornis TaxID=44386 RepID=A0A9J6FY99_HAELO|nr:hypothetical protein HPB48_021379 [Haemaphysalis longicornis]
MALFPFYNRGFRGFFDDDDFGGSFLDGELFDPPFYHQRFYIQPRHHQPSSQRSTGVCPARQQQGTSVACTPDKFAINVDTRHFAPEEISVKTENNCVVIHGKHEEKSDDRGCYVKREFTRRYVLSRRRRPGDRQVPPQAERSPGSRGSALRQCGGPVARQPGCASRGASQQGRLGRVRVVQQGRLGPVRAPAQHQPQVRPGPRGQRLVDVQPARPPLDALHQRAQRLLQPHGVQAASHVHEGALQALGPVYALLAQEVPLARKHHDQGQAVDGQPVLLLQVGQQGLLEALADVLQPRLAGVHAQAAVGQGLRAERVIFKNEVIFKNAKNEAIFKKVERREVVWARLLDYDKRQADPARLHNRGGRLLTEMKEAKRLETELPRPEREITSYIDNYAGEERGVFESWSAQFLSHLEAQHAAFNDKKERQRLEREQRRQKGKRPRQGSPTGAVSKVSPHDGPITHRGPPRPAKRRSLKLQRKSVAAQKLGMSDSKAPEPQANGQARAVPTSQATLAVPGFLPLSDGSARLVAAETLQTTSTGQSNTRCYAGKAGMSAGFPFCGGLSHHSCDPTDCATPCNGTRRTSTQTTGAEGP